MRLSKRRLSSWSDLALRGPYLCHETGANLLPEAKKSICSYAGAMMEWRSTYCGSTIAVDWRSYVDVSENPVLSCFGEGLPEPCTQTIFNQWKLDESIHV